MQPAPAPGHAHLLREHAIGMWDRMENVAAHRKVEGVIGGAKLVRALVLKP